jgi:hypothetical protein
MQWRSVGSSNGKPGSSAFHILYRPSTLGHRFPALGPPQIHHWSFTSPTASSFIFPIFYAIWSPRMKRRVEEVMPKFVPVLSRWIDLRCREQRSIPGVDILLVAILLG